MSRRFVSAAGLRRDGRRPTETRRLQCRFGVLGKCDGSVYLEQGCNKVLVAVRGPRAVGFKSKEKFDRARLSCVYTVAPFARTEHRKRRRHDKRAGKAALSIQRTFEGVVQSQLFPRTEIHISVQVLQSDGSELSASINATTLALLDAGIPCNDFVISCSVGHLDEHAILDLNYEEEASGGPVIRTAMLPSTGRMILVELSSKMSTSAFEECLLLTQSGCRQIYELLKAAVEERVLKLHSSKLGIISASPPAKQ